MRIRALAFVLTMSVCVPALSEPAPLLGDTVRQLAAARVDAGVYPSLVIGVVSGDRIEIVALGTLGDDQKRLPDGKTVYEIGSVTKTFTALLLADAVVCGEATLDQPVERLMPGTSIPRSGNRAISLLDLATQSSGLPRVPANLLPKDASNPYADYAVGDLRQFLASYRLPRAPGERYEYSNLGFGLLGQALALRAGSSYAELVQSRIAVPLGMSDTAIALTPGMVERFAAGHDGSGKAAPSWDLGALEGAGAVRSTANDMLDFVAAHMHPSTGPLAKAAALVAKPQRPTDNERVKIGLAWQLESRAGREIAWHNGMTGGYSAFAGFTADGERGIVVLTNISRDVSEIGIAALVPELQAQPAPVELSLSAKELDEYVGRYRLAPGFDLTVIVSGSELQVQATGQPVLPAFASARDEFFYKAVDAQLSFQRDSKGKVSGVVLHQNGRDMPAPRIENEPSAQQAPASEIKLDAAALVPYVGRYALTPAFILDVTSREGQLYVQATGQGRVPVYPSARDEFFYKVVDAQLSFQRAADGSVGSLVLHQNGQHLKGMKLQ